MTFNLITEGLAMQAASLGKGRKESKPEAAMADSPGEQGAIDSGQEATGGAVSSGTESAATQGNGITGADTSPSSASASAADHGQKDSAATQTNQGMPDERSRTGSSPALLRTHTEKKPESQPLDYVTPIWEQLAAIGEAAPAGAWDNVPVDLSTRADYHEPIANVCPSCGRKHTGRFQLCLSCSQKE